MPKTGRLASWNDDRGFGFIEAYGGERVFVHIRSIARIATRPRIGDRLRFEIGTGRDGRPAAVRVEIAGANPVSVAAMRRGLPAEPPRPLNGRRLIRVVLVAALALALVAAIGSGHAPVWLGWFYLGMGLVSGLVYWADKRRAEAEAWRIPESRLHAVDFAFGIAGGLAAQAAFNHKVSKPGFAAVTMALAGLHILGLASLAAGLVDVPGLA